MFCVAPGEGQKPIGILNDKYFEEMCTIQQSMLVEDMDLLQTDKPGLQCASTLTLVIA